MANCPICQTEYTENQVSFCTTCGWDLTPYPVTFPGHIPNEFMAKEKAKFNWAKQAWLKLKTLQDQLNQQQLASQQQLTEILTKFDQFSQVPSQQLTESISTLTQQLTTIQQQLTTATAERQQLQTQVNQLNQSQIKYQQKLAQEIVTPQTLLNFFTPINEQLTAIQTQLESAKIEEPIPEPPPSLKIKLREFSFVGLTVNRQGKIINSQSQKAQEFLEDLGNNIILEMVSIPGGTFLMGAPDGEGSADEKPQHQVTVSAFLMGKYPITQGQWKRVANLPKVRRDLKPDPSNFKGDRRPVENVNWYDAVEFCARLYKYTGTAYRLPSEAEWEYACRAGTTSPFYFGETITSQLANYNGSIVYASEPPGQYRQQTNPVGEFSPNAFGLCDLHGNVWEWCADPWHDSYADAPILGEVWDDLYENDNCYQVYGVENLVNYLLDDGRTRCLRGGSWDIDPDFCRSALRFRNDPGYCHNVCGFRVASCFPGQDSCP
jgi:formylglycine-generating enzyme required for sulfatase activity